MSGTKVQIKYGYGTPAPGSLKLAELAIDLNDESLWTADSDGNIVRVGHNTDGIEIDIDQILEELKDRVLHNDERNIIEEGAFQIVWRDDDPSYDSFTGTIGYNRGAAGDPNGIEGSFVFAGGVNEKTGLQATLSIGRDADLELEGDNAIRGKAGAGGHTPIVEGFKHVQADDFLDANGDSIIGNHDSDIANLQGQINNNAGDISALRDDFDNHDHALDDLSDVSAANPSRDDLLVWTGTSWSASSFDLIETSLNFKGASNVAKAAPSADKGDLYVNDTTGTASASWTGISGKVVNAGNFIGYANSQWYLLGEIAEIGVTSVIEGLAISVDDSKPAEPVVSIDRKETDKWYADKGHDHSGVYEPVINPKNSAFNKSFAGSGSANTVSRSDHTHNYSPSDHDHAGVYEPVISPKRTAFNKDFSGSGSADTVSRSDHTHNYSPIGHDHAGVYEPVINPKNSAFNKNFGTASGTVAQGNHDHAGVYEPVINPKRTAFNKDFGTTAGTVAEGSHKHALDDLSDVNASNPSRDDLLIWNGSSWSASSFDLIETALNFKGATNVAQAAPAAEQGDLYVNNTQGTAAASWTGIAGKVVNAGNFIGYANGRWYLLGEIADVGVTQVVQGLAISVDDSKPAEPVVSVDRAETDKWYADKGHDHSGVYEPVINPKNSAFNKSFAGSGSANTVSRSDHTHSEYLTDLPAVINGGTY